jgi:hypothetical protein
MMKKSFLFILFITFLLAVSLFADDVSTGDIEGQVMISGEEPMSKGMVAFFNTKNGPAPDANRYLRIPDTVAVVDAEGKFRTSLPSGRYYISGIKKMSGRQMGPPQDGDHIFTSKDEKKIPIEYVVEKDKSLSVKIIARTETFRRTPADGASGISGTISDQNDDPIENAVVYAYKTKGMIGLPAFASYRTGKDGKFMVRVDKGGEYYLQVRDPYSGGPPLSGDVVGDFGGYDPTAIIVTTGEITRGIDINLTERINKRR